jgi:hypothetical protein
VTGSRWRSIRAAIDGVGAVVLVALVIAPLRTLFFLDETEPFRRRWRRRR